MHGRNSPVASRRRGAAGWFCGAAVLGIALAATPLRADDDDGARSAERGEKGWIVSIGVMPQSTPDFPGAKTAGIDFAPQFSFRRKGEPAGFGAPDDGFDYAIVDTPRVRFGPVADYESGRSASSHHSLTGLDQYSATLQTGAFVEFWPVEEVFRRRLEVMHGLRDGDGFLANLSADLVHHDRMFTFSAGPRVTLVDSDEMELKFGVSPQAAARNGRASAFDAEGGVQALGVNATINYDLVPGLDAHGLQPL